MDVPVVHHSLIQDPPVHVGYQQTGPSSVHSHHTHHTIIGDNGDYTHHSHHHVDKVDPPMVPVYQQPPPRVVQHVETVRVPVTTHHVVSLPIEITHY